MTALAGRLLAALGAGVLALGALGCTGPRYLAQAARGQIDLLCAKRDLDDVVADPGTSPRIRALLAEVPRIKSFGEKHGLTATGSYSEYVDVHGPAVVWVVSAAPQLSLEPKTWSFPIVGSVPYLGWFDPDDAHRFARELRAESLDVHLRGAGAYSTLGWFDDPVLSTMLGDGDEALGELANDVLHESVHATLYVEDQTFFNESIASFAGDLLADRFLDQTRGPGSPQKRAYLEGREGGEERAAALRGGLAALERLYASSLPVPRKLAEKARILRALEQEVGATIPINNAVLLQFKAYHASPTGLGDLLRTCQGDFPRFFRALRRIDARSFSTPHQEDLRPVLTEVARKGC
jgi:predicted aminopeptidase